jgi:hypothetical protein
MYWHACSNADAPSLKKSGGMLTRAAREGGAFFRLNNPNIIAIVRRHIRRCGELVKLIEPATGAHRQEAGDQPLSRKAAAGTSK